LVTGIRGSLVGAGLAVLAVLAVLAMPTGAGAVECANAGIRAAQGAATAALPDCMALEMVSPPEKNNQFARYPNVSATGERVRFRSIAALAGTPNLLQAVEGDPYLATRSPQGWETQPTTPPAAYLKGWYKFSEAKSFAPDFSRWLNVAATTPQYETGSDQAFVAGVGGLFEPMSPLLVPLGAGRLSDVENSGMAGVSGDLSHLYFRPGQSNIATDHTTAYLPGDPRPSGTSNIGLDYNVYVARLDSEGRPSVELLARDGAGNVVGGNCGVRLGGTSRLQNAEEGQGGRDQGAVSASGSRAYFSARPGQPATGSCEQSSYKLRIFKRIEGPQGAFIGQLYGNECTRAAPACSSVDGNDYYQGASLDQSKVYFATNRQLANSDLDGSAAECAKSSGTPGCDLYLYDESQPAGQRLIQVSAGEDVPGKHVAGKEADLYNGIAAISADGSHVYFAAAGVLTAHKNPEGEEAQQGKPNLYLYERDAAHPNGRLSFLGTLDEGDGPIGMWGGEGTWRNQAYPVPVLSEAEQRGEGGEEGGDGHVLLFESKAQLSAEDRDGTHRDVFRYDASANPPSLVCVSCAPAPSAVEPDTGPYDVTARGLLGAAGASYAEEGRWASEDGESVLFRTPEPLVGPIEGTTGQYLWREGQTYRLPGVPYVTNSAEDGPALSHDGSTVAFQTYSQLLPQDGDTSPDVYVARAGGGFAPPASPAPCAPDGGAACQGAAPAAPPSPGGGSAALAGAGNTTPPPARPRCPKGKRLQRRHGKPRCVARRHKRRHRKRHRHHHRHTHAAIHGRAAR